jgi:hypothetical protein
MVAEGEGKARFFSAILEALKNVGASVKSFSEDLEAESLPFFNSDFTSAESGKGFSVAGGGGGGGFHGVISLSAYILARPINRATAFSSFFSFFLLLRLVATRHPPHFLGI